MESIKFIHLHNHSEYSVLDGLCRIPELICAAVENGMPALGLTDHGNMFGAIKFYKECLNKNIRPVIGSEFYLAPESLERKEKIDSFKYYHIILLAKNMDGYKNLLKLSSISYIKGFYYKPRIDKYILKEYSKGLICTTACILSDISQSLLSGAYDTALHLAQYYQNIFKDDFYIELQNHNLKNEINILNELVEIARKLSIPIVATNDVHYIKKEDAETHNIFLKINTGSLLSDRDSFAFDKNQEFYFKNQDEMIDLFSDYPSSISATKEIAIKCNLDLAVDKNIFYFPQYKSDTENSSDCLEKKCKENLPLKYPDNQKEAIKRLEYELKIIKEKKFENYFLIISDLVDYARKNNIFVGPGRGSSASSIVSYLLGITSTDPLRYNLLFERFLNPKRLKMPDIDLDFEHLRRDELYDYLRKKYGQNCVAHIITFGTLQERNSIRDVARVYELAQGDIEILVSILESYNYNFDLTKLQHNNDYKILKKKYNMLDNIVYTANKLLNITRHISIHPAGIVISPKELTEFVPLYFEAKSNLIVSQYDMHSIDSIGLLKIDVLAIKTLTIIKETLEQVNQKYDLSKLNLNDNKIFELFQTGNTVGIFQFESEGMRDLLVRLNPKNIEDIIAILAMYRPGVLQSGMVDNYVAVKNGSAQPKYIHNDLLPVLKETYGVILYQEQVMQIAHIIAGYSLGEADILRTAMSKKKVELMEEQREPFIKGALQNGYEEKTAEEIFNLIEKFAGYGFPKSHSAAYAMLAYQTAYLKTYYPLEFMIAILNNENHNSDKISLFVSECRRLGFEFIMPDFNNCSVKYCKENNNIKIGLAAIKNVGEKIASSIVNEIQKNGLYTNLIDFTARNLVYGLNKNMLESLIKTGLFDNLYKSREKLIDNLNEIIEKAEHLDRTRKSKTLELFDEFKDISVNDEFIKHLENITDKELFKNIIFEKEVLGFSYTPSPLRKYKIEIRLFSNLTKEKNISDLKELRFIAFIDKVIEKTSLNNNIYAEINLHTLDYSFKGYIFSREYILLREKIKENNVYLIEGIYDKKYKSVILHNIHNITELYNTAAKKIYIRLYKNSVDTKIPKIKNIIDSLDDGKVEVYIYAEYKEKNFSLIKIKKKVSLTKEKVYELLELVSSKNIKIR